MRREKGKNDFKSALLQGLRPAGALPARSGHKQPQAGQWARAAHTREGEKRRQWRSRAWPGQQPVPNRTMSQRRNDATKATKWRAAAKDSCQSSRIHGVQQQQQGVNRQRKSLKRVAVIRRHHQAAGSRGGTKRP